MSTYESARGAGLRLSLPTLTEASRLDWLAAAGVLVIGLQAFRSVHETDLDLGTRVLVATVMAAIVIGSATALLVGDRVPAGLAALVAGMQGIATGAYAVGELAFGGVSPGALLGTAAVAIGALLTLAGLIGLVRATPGWWRLAAVPIAFIVVQFGLLPATMGIYGTHPARSPFTTEVPAGAVPVSLLTSDGVSLAGWYTPGENRAAIVLLHGAGGTKADTRAQAAELAAAGYGVLAIDARGSGESAGRGMLWGWHGDLDIGAAVAWLASRPEIDPARIGAVGLSMGGEQAITAAATNPGLHAVVAEGASARTPADAVALLGGDLSGAIQRVFYPIMWATADAFTSASPPIPLADAVRALGERELLLISSDDPNDKAAGPLLRDAAPASVTLWEPSNGHTQALAVHPDEWRTRVVSFLDRTLAP